jgi:hypothetical protein
MFETDKIREAQFFYAWLLRTERIQPDNPEHFKWFLSAFLSAARSVLQFAHREAVGDTRSASGPTSGKPGGKLWYDSAMSSSQMLSFFKGKRDDNVHFKPVTAVKEISIHIAESMLAWINTLDASDTGAPLLAPPPSPYTTVTTIEKYKFDDWPGSEGVLQMCDNYLTKLSDMVKDGQQRGLLTP